MIFWFSFVFTDDCSLQITHISFALRNVARSVQGAYRDTLLLLPSFLPSLPFLPLSVLAYHIIFFPFLLHSSTPDPSPTINSLRSIQTYRVLNLSLSHCPSSPHTLTDSITHRTSSQAFVCAGCPEPSRGEEGQGTSCVR